MPQNLPWINNWDKYKESREALSETNDCSVVAFAEVFNTTYERAHRHLRMNCGRKDKNGIRSAHVIPPSLKNTRFRVGEYSRKEYITINQFTKKHPVGRYYVCVRGHALAIIDGVVHDHCSKPARRIIFAMRIHL